MQSSQPHPDPRQDHRSGDTYTKATNRGSTRTVSPEPRVATAPLRIAYGARDLPDWQLFARIVDFLLRARGTDEVIHRAAASIGLLPQVAWTDLDGGPAGHPNTLSLFLGELPDTASAPSVPRWLEVRLVDSPPQAASALVSAILGLVEQVLVREQDAEHLAGAAYTDPLTRLWNRRGFEPLMRQALTRRQRNGERLALLVCDIDRFKTINDTYGHAAGDRALRCVADVIRSVVRPCDVAVRLGGDELAVLLSGSTAQGAQQVAKRLAVALEDANPLATRPLTLSIGIADTSMIFGDEPDVHQAFFAAADEALYRAKANGRNQAVVHPACIAE